MTAPNFITLDVETAREIARALEDAEEFFDNRADAEMDETGYVPNEEMLRLVDVSRALAKLLERL